jgi:hypothetical protein
MMPVRQRQQQLAAANKMNSNEKKTTNSAFRDSCVAGRRHFSLRGYPLTMTMTTTATTTNSQFYLPFPRVWTEQVFLSKLSKDSEYLYQQLPP